MHVTKMVSLHTSVWHWTGEWDDFTLSFVLSDLFYCIFKLYNGQCVPQEDETTILYIYTHNLMELVFKITHSVSFFFYRGLFSG